jgi:hypothetical protein
MLITDDLYRDGLDKMGNEVEIVPLIRDLELTKIKGCFARLRIFDREFQEWHFNIGDRIVCLDLDSVITGSIDYLFNTSADFLILQGANAANPCPYNGSVWMVRAGWRHDVWEDFSIEAASRVPFYEFPDDQGWFAHKLPGAPGWKVGESGIYAFRKPAWPKGDALPSNARIVCFPGNRDPSQFVSLPWVKEHWQ